MLFRSKKEEVERGQVLAKPGSVSPHTSFKSEVYVLTKDEGRRHTPFFTGYKPQFYFRTTDITGEVNLPDGVEMVMPGDNIEMSVELIHPIAMEEGLRFAIREGGRTVASGVVATIVKYLVITIALLVVNIIAYPHMAPELVTRPAGNGHGENSPSREFTAFVPPLILVVVAGLITLAPS